MGREFLKERITATKLQIVAYEGAVDALASGVQSYSLNTGQSQQSVTRSNLGEINRTLDSLYNRLVTLEARLTGNGVTRIRPAW
jgi:hypothetical protein